MGPPVFLERSVGAGLWRLGSHLSVFGWVLELEFVPKIVGRPGWRLTIDGESGQVLGFRCVGKVESEQSLVIADVGFDGEGALTASSGSHEPSLT